MTISGYIVVGIIMLLDIVSIVLCSIVNEKEMRYVSIVIFVLLIGLMLYTLPI
jgi:predicted membrane channel-forming protein YqfA (hemolysin III family)